MAKLLKKLILILFLAAPAILRPEEISANGQLPIPGDEPGSRMLMPRSHSSQQTTIGAFFFPVLPANPTAQLMGSGFGAQLFFQRPLPLGRASNFLQYGLLLGFNSLSSSTFFYTSSIASIPVIPHLQARIRFVRSHFSPHLALGAGATFSFFHLAYTDATLNNYVVSSPTVDLTTVNLLLMGRLGMSYFWPEKKLEVFANAGLFMQMEKSMANYMIFTLGVGYFF